MLGSAAVQIVKDRLSFRTDLDTQIENAFVEAQFEFENASTLPWWLIEEDATFAFVADTASYALPADFISFVEDELPYYYVTTSALPIYLKRAPLDDARVSTAREEDSSYNNYPSMFALRTGTIEVFPTPAAAHTVYYSYYKKAAAFSLSAENSWLAYNPYRLIGRAGQIVAQEIEHQEAERRFTEMYRRWSEWQLRQEAQREATGMPRALGSNR